MLTYTLTIKLLSDTTFGRGDGLAGLIDQEVEHDPDGFPYLRGRTLKGLLSEECDNFIVNLPDRQRWEAIAQQLFGVLGSTLNTMAIMHVGDACLPEDLRQAIAYEIQENRLTRSEVLESLTTVRRQTAIDPFTGTPDRGSLRSSRVVIRNFEFTAGLQFESPPTDEIKALLSVGTLALRHLGSGRNRGRGLVQCTLHDQNKQDITGHYLHFFGSTVSQVVAKEGAKSMKAITFSFTTLQPLLATSFLGDPNSDVSYAYVPGSMIRGAVIGRYMRHHHIRDLDDAPDFDQVRRLFFNAQNTRYLNAYLSSNNGQRTLPIPRSWRKEKDAEFSDRTSRIAVYDFSLGLSSLDTPKLLGEGFWSNEGGKVRLYHEKRRINVHHWRDRKKGRATRDQGDIFRYDALDAGQTFQAAILCDDTDESILRDLLNFSPDIWLGGSQSAGYGHTKLTINDSSPNWTEVATSVQERSQHDGLIITLLSDALLRDESGQPVADPGLIKQAIENVLDVDLPNLRNGETFASNTLIGGFNRKWGLPLPQLPAIEAGSVIAFDTDECPLTEAQIQQLEEQGIGDRREDGFGRVVINWLDQESFYVQQAESYQIQQPSLSLTSHSVAEKMAKRIIQQKLDQKLIDQVGRLEIKGDISNRQLSRLRLVARQALSEENCTLNSVSNLLSNLPKNASDQFNTAKIGSLSLRKQLDEWLDAPGNWISNPPTVTIAGTSYTVTSSLQREYTLRLIMAITKKAVKGGELL